MALFRWLPLAGGILAGRYPLDGDAHAGSRATRGSQIFQARITRKGREVAAKVDEMAQERDMTIIQLSLLWAKDQPGVTSLILGPRTMEHLEDALHLLEMTLDDADRPLFDELVYPGTAVSDFHNSNQWMKARILE